MRIVKLQLEGFNGPLILNTAEEVLEEVKIWLSAGNLKNTISKDTCIDDEMTLTIGEMSDEEFKNLPEFQGF